MEFKEIGYSEWLNTYKIRLDKDGCPKTYETYGEDFEEVRRNFKKAWTLTDSDEGEEPIIQSHVHFVNRIAYYIGEVEIAPPEEVHIQVNDEDD